MSGWGSGGWGDSEWGSGFPSPPIPLPPPIPPPGPGYGEERYGLDAYGSAGTIGQIELQAALAISTHQVVVTLTGAAQAIVATLPGDALNPATWLIQRLDTNVYFHVIDVEENTPTEFILTTIEPFGPASVTHQVSSFVLLDSFGDPVGQPNAANFLGIVADVVATQGAMIADRRAVATDIANPQVPNQYGIVGGTLVVTSGGDYDTVSGNDLLRKLIVRRLTTPIGAFFHLPDYGVGLPLKELVSSADLVKLKASIELQLKAEPEVQSVTATLSQDSTGLLLLTVFVVPNNGSDPIAVTMAAAPGVTF